jgi:hypothetical protein
MTTKATILQAIRHKCLDCSCYQPVEVRECPVRTCGLWPYRFGTDPDPNPSRGFAKSPVYAGHSATRAADSIPDAPNVSSSGIGLQHADFCESEGIAPSTIAGDR